MARKDTKDSFSTKSGGIAKAKATERIKAQGIPAKRKAAEAAAKAAKKREGISGILTNRAKRLNKAAGLKD